MKSQIEPNDAADGERQAVMHFDAFDVNDEDYH
jgi:hypothetical protein